MENADDISLNTIISTAINGDEASLNNLLTSLWLMELLAKISRRLAKKYRPLDPIAIRDAMWEILRRKIQDIKNPNGRPLTQCLGGWCKSSGRRVCQNMIRHTGVENRYSERVFKESTHGRRSTVKGSFIPLHFPTSKSPEEIFFRNQQMSGLYRRIYDALNEFPAQTIDMALAWADGMTLVQVKEAYGIPVSTVGRHRKEFQRELIEKLGIDELLAAEHKVANNLILNCLSEMISLGYFPRRAA